jgi:hypothetical protein
MIKPEEIKGWENTLVIPELSVEPSGGYGLKYGYRHLKFYPLSRFRPAVQGALRSAD